MNSLKNIKFLLEIIDTINYPSQGDITLIIDWISKKRYYADTKEKLDVYNYNYKITRYIDSSYRLILKNKFDIVIYNQTEDIFPDIDFTLRDIKKMINEIGQPKSIQLHWGNYILYNYI